MTDIILVTDSARLDGGISQVAIQSAAALARAGYRVHYFAGEGPADPLLLAHLPDDRIHIQNTKSLAGDTNAVRAALNGIANRTCCRALEKLLAGFARDRTIIHIHGWCKNLSPHIVHTAVRSGLPVVQTLHEYFLVCPNGAFYDFRAGEICHRKPVGLSCALCNCDSRRYAHKLWRLSRGAYQKFALGLPRREVTYLANSPLTRRIFEKHLPAGASIVDVLNPISIVRGERSPAEKQKPILFVGRFSREKGVLHLAKAIGELGLPAVFVGDGHLRAEMQELAPSAIFPGWQTPEGVAQWMRQARALAFPSTWYETLGLVTVEAAAVGLPSIISDCTAAIDFFPDGHSALHCRQGSVDDLKARLIQVSDDNLVRQLSENAYNDYWRAPWTPERHANDLARVYERLLSATAVNR